jgi:hypothetical protein
MMKQSSAVLTILLAVLLFSPGCKSPEHTAFVATASVTQLADAAIGAFAEYRQTHEVPLETVLQVRKIASQYKAAVVSAEIAQRTYSRVKGTLAETDARARAEAALQAADAAAQAVIQVIYAIHPELKPKATP